MVLSYAVGLYLGFGGFIVQGIATAAAFAAAAILRRSALVAACAAILATGVLVALVAQREADQCVDHALEAREWSVLLYQSATPGTFVQGAIQFDRCQVRAGVALSKGEGAAGDLVHLRGTAVRGSRSIVIQRGEVISSKPASALRAIRESAGNSIDRIHAERATVVRALLIADSRQLDRAVRERFADAGLVHMLSISGLHVGIIAAAVHLLLRAARARPSAALLGAAAVTSLYVMLIGAPPAAVRAGTMFAVMALCRLIQRPTSPWAALALGALVPLVRPETVTAIGYQLSVAGMIGIISAGRLTSRIAPRLQERPVVRHLTDAVVATVLASLATAPIVAWHFGRISLIAPLTNPVAGPIFLLLQPMLFLSLLLAPIQPLAEFVADATVPLLAAIQLTATAAASVPYAATDFAPSLFSLALALLAAAGVLAAAAGRRPVRQLLVAAGSTAALLWLPIFPTPARGNLEVHMLDVGQGDAIAVRLPDRSWLLFDAGPASRGGDEGRRTVIPYIQSRGGKLRGFVLSHPHSDHVGGASSVVRWLQPQRYWDAAFVAANSDYLSSLKQAREKGVQWERVRPGTLLDWGGAQLEFLAPDSAWTVALRDPNDASTVVLLTYGSIRFLFTGDAEALQEEWLLRRYGPRLRAEVLKVGHHGSRTSSTMPFLAAVRPQIALVSAGRGNRYGHPSAEIMGRLAGLGALVLRTDQLGTTVVITDGKRLWLEALGERWLLP